MSEPSKVILKITSVKGTCAAGHKVGDEFDLSQDFTLGYSSLTLDESSTIQNERGRK